MLRREGYIHRGQQPTWTTGLTPLEGSLAMSKSRGSYPGSPPLGLHAADAIRRRLHDARSETVKCSIICNRELETKSSSTGNTVKHTLAGERIRTFL